MIIILVHTYRFRIHSMKTIFKRFLFFVFLCVSSTLAIAQTYTFTNAGATGREGPTQSQIDSNYSGTNLEDKVTIITRGIQEWTVPESGTYRLKLGVQKGVLLMKIEMVVLGQSYRVILLLIKIRC